MERLVEYIVTQPASNRWVFFAAGDIDRRSLVAALGCGVTCFLLAYASIEITRFGGSLATIWLPAAAAIACLLRTDLKNEIPFLAAVPIGILSANFASHVPSANAILFASANLIEVAVVLALTRRSCGPRPDMKDLDHLARFVWFGGLIGPLASATIVIGVTAIKSDPIAAKATGWLLAHSMGMILIAPTALLVYDALTQRRWATWPKIAENAFLFAIGSVCTFLVLNQVQYPLLFMVPPITLLFAFRLGSLGTALFVFVIAAMTVAMTWYGLGPIAAMVNSDQDRSHVLQAFVAANFLTGLPIAAILAGRNRIMAELDLGRRELALLTENTTDALMYFDLQGRCTYASSSVQEVMGEPPESFIGKRPSDRMHKDAKDQIVRAENRLLSGASDKERFTYRRYLDSKHGTPVFLEAECAIAHNPETGAREGIVVSARDVTVRVELELLLTRARRKAENAAKSKTEFLANMSHEIRTPMNGVLGFSELMLQTDLDDGQRHNMELIVQSGRSMMMLLNDILDLSKIEAGQITIDPEPVDLDATIAECAALQRPTAEKKGLELVFENEADAPWIMTDGLRLRQIVLNLIGNAIKFTEVGRVTVTCRTDEDQLVISVTDTGIGISAKRTKQIFDPFTQAESNTARRFGGTGLGLSISRQLAEMLGGRLSVDSEVGVGSCFKLALPMIKVRPKSLAQPGLEEDIEIPLQTNAVPVDRSVEANALDSADLPSGSRILLAEDHDVNRMLATEMLERCGQEVSVAHDGNEAITMVLDAYLRGNPFDLVLMDVQMPGCDGYAATRAIRGESIGGDMLPIIALTANAFPEDIAAARDAGMQAHLAKPLEFAKLARALQRWLPTRIIEDDALPSAVENAKEDEAAVVEGAAIEKRVQSALTKQRERRRFRHRNGVVENSGRTQETRVVDFPAHSSTSSAPSHSPALLQKWEQRREQALQAVQDALSTETFDGERGKGLTSLLHKLAGTAAMFGEEELGKKATEMERALKQGNEKPALVDLARELIALAAERDAAPVSSGAQG